jgi:hypothetical protein
MVSDYRSIFFNTMTKKIHDFIRYDLTKGRIQKQKNPYTDNEINNFINNNRELIQNVIDDIVIEYEIDVYSKEKLVLEDHCIKAMLYEYIRYDLEEHEED